MIRPSTKPMIFAAAVAALTAIVLGCQRDALSGPNDVQDAAISRDAAPLCDGLHCSGCDPGRVLVPGGTFMMGANDLAAVGKGSTPVHQVTLSTFCLDRTEVTVGAYRDCVTAGACTPPDGADNSPACNAPLANHEHHPINCVDWMQASSYCKWAGGRLPTEAQWEYAARYSDERDYPWGNGGPVNQLCWDRGGPPFLGTCPVGSYPNGDTSLGIADMAGNVWEWVADWADVYPDGAVTDPTGPLQSPSHEYVDRGGSWDNKTGAGVRSAHRDGSSPSRRLYTLGFRCAGITKLH